MSRQIVGLDWARACNRPSCIPKSRPRGKKAAGLRYERELARAIPGGTHGQWFEFSDRAGHGWCQPDIYFEQAGALFVLEAKYTWTEAGHRQIERLYKPVLEAALRCPVFGIVVAKVLLPEMPITALCRSLADAIDCAQAGGRVCLHWVGVGLEPFRQRLASSHVASELACL